MAGTVVVTPAAKATAGLSSSGAPVLTSSRPAAVSATPSATVGDGRAPWDPIATPPRCRVVLLPARVASLPAHSMENREKLAQKGQLQTDARFPVHVPEANSLF